MKNKSVMTFFLPMKNLSVCVWLHCVREICLLMLSEFNYVSYFKYDCSAVTPLNNLGMDLFYVIHIFQFVLVIKMIFWWFIHILQQYSRTSYDIA